MRGLVWGTRANELHGFKDEKFRTGLSDSPYTPHIRHPKTQWPAIYERPHSPDQWHRQMRAVKLKSCKGLFLPTTL